MEVHKLEPNLVAKIKSSTTINSVTQCITELVLNSLDARSTAVAVRINFVTFRIQVVDNGDGITKENLNLIGQRYMTSKCNNLEQLESHCVYYGFRGEALASIINISKVVEITSKPINGSETLSRKLTKTTRNNAIPVKDRPSCGTTVTIEGFLYNLVLRKKRINPEVEFVYIKRNLECFIIMHPNVSFSLRNDVTGDLILNSQKCTDVISSFKSLHPELTDDYSLIKVAKNNITIKALLFKELWENNSMQYIYVNKRPVKCSKIQTFIYNLFQKNKKFANQIFHSNQNDKNKHHVYLISIKCPHSFVDILLSPAKTIVEFKNWDIIFSCLEKFILSFLGCNEKTVKENYVGSRKVKSDCGISQIHGVFKSYGVKRKMNCDDTTSPRKMQKIISTGTREEDDEIAVPQHSIDIFSNPEPISEQIINSVAAKNTQNIVSLKNTNNISQFSYECNKENSVIVDKQDKLKNVPNILICANNNDLQKRPLPVRHISNQRIRPLPVKVFNRNYIQNLNSAKCMPPHYDEPKPYKMHDSEICNVNTSRAPDEKSSLTKFTNDEKKGKNLIMDMFLKSTQVFNSDDGYQNDRSGDTVFEEESNYFLENNITTNVNGKCKTMSVSINITRKIKKKCNTNKKRQVTSKMIQTSLQKNEMVGKCVQTSMYQKHDHSSILNSLPANGKLTENYTIILSRSKHKSPKFRFVYRSPFNLCHGVPRVPVSEDNCSCNCHSRRKNIFNFSNFTCREYAKSKRNSRKANNFYNLNFYDKPLSPIDTFQDHCTKQNNLRLMENVTEPEKDYFRKNNRSNGGVLSINERPFAVNETVNESFYYSENPYLATGNYIDFKNNTFLNTSSDIDRRYELFHPQYQSTQMNQLLSKRNVTDMSFIRDRYKSFQHIAVTPRNKATSKIIQKPVEEKSNTIVRHNPIHKKITSALQTKPTPDLEEEELFISLSNRQKQEILEKELNTEKQFYNELNLEWASQMEISKEKEEAKQNESKEFGEWIKKRSNFGSNFYVNKRTGFTTFYTPKPISNNFKIDKRFEFMPKGLSPILKEIKEVDKSLSQNRKDKLENYILESYQNDLLTIKWQNYIKNNDSKTFFDEMYREKLNSLENCIPSVLHNKKYCSELSCPITFDKALFDNITVIGQLDKKFIVAVEETKHLVILFDQHAVHERIRLEDLLKSYSNAKVSCHRDKFIVFLSCNDLSLLRKHEEYLNFLGLFVEFFEDGINIVEIPLCLHNKFKDSDGSLNTVIQLLIKEIIELIKDTRGVTFKNLPKIIQNILNLEACRGAIKFGDKLSNNDCEEVLKKLSICDLPFQCAHGRPTLVPSITLNLTNPTGPKTLTFKNIHNKTSF